MEADEIVLVRFLFFNVAVNGYAWQVEDQRK